MSKSKKSVKSAAKSVKASAKVVSKKSSIEAAAAQLETPSITTAVAEATSPVTEIATEAVKAEKIAKGPSKYELYKAAVAARKIERETKSAEKLAAMTAKSIGYIERKKAAAERREARKVNAAKIKETAAAKKLARAEKAKSFWSSKIEKRSTWAAKRIATAFTSGMKSAGLASATVSVDYVTKKFGKSADVGVIVTKLNELGVKAAAGEGVIVVG